MRRLECRQAATFGWRAPQRSERMAAETEPGLGSEHISAHALCHQSAHDRSHRELGRRQGPFSMELSCGCAAVSVGTRFRVVARTSGERRAGVDQLFALREPTWFGCYDSGAIGGPKRVGDGAFYATGSRRSSHLTLFKSPENPSEIGFHVSPCKRHREWPRSHRDPSACCWK